MTEMAKSNKTTYGALRFPVVSAQGVDLETVQCILSPRERMKKSFVIHGPDPEQVESVLGESRSSEHSENSTFSVNVRFVPNRFTDMSYSLALAISDKWVRGCWKSFPQEADVYATGILVPGESGLIGKIQLFSEKIDFLLQHARVGSYIVVPQQNVDELDEQGKSNLVEGTARAGVTLIAIHHLNELENYWSGSSSTSAGPTALPVPEDQQPEKNAPAKVIKINRPANWIGLAVLVLLAFLINHFLDNIKSHKLESKPYELAGGSADQLWCASASLNEYLATWHYSSKKPPCEPFFNPQEKRLVSLIAAVESQPDVVDLSLLKRYRSFESEWLGSIRESSPYTLKLIDALDRYIDQLTAVESRAEQLHRLVVEFEAHRNFKTADALMANLSELSSFEQSGIQGLGINLQAIEKQAQGHIKTVSMRKVAVEYYWEKLQSGDLDTQERLYNSAEILGKSNWWLLHGDVQKFLEKNAEPVQPEIIPTKMLIKSY